MMMMDIYSKQDFHEPEIYITTSLIESVPVNITSARDSYSHSIEVSQNRPAIDHLHRSVRSKGSGVNKNAIIVSSTGDISVISVNQEDHTLDGFLALPLEALGTEYFAVMYSPGELQHSQIGVVATEDGTIVSFALPTNKDVFVEYGGEKYRGGDIITITINLKETFQLQSPSDLTRYSCFCQQTSVCVQWK